jgi:hypothetical protein
MKELTQHIVVRQFRAEVLLTAIYQLFDNPKIRMISEIYHKKFR